MRAFHCNWSAPFCARNPAEYAIAPFDLLSTALSALIWRKNGGSIAMFCDSTAAAYYCARGLDGLWDAGLIPLRLPADIDPHIFWAAGKLFALRAFGAPCVMLDTDLIVWEPLDCGDTPLTVIHREDLQPAVYPGPDAFPAAKGFDFSSLDWSVLPANTALAYFGDPAFTEYYTGRAIEFMRACKGADNPLTYMVFAEQRLLAMLAKEQGVPLSTFSNLPTLFGGEQTRFTHIWGFKQYMARNTELLERFCRRCAIRLQKEAPDWAERLANVPELAAFFAPYPSPGSGV